MTLTRHNYLSKLPNFKSDDFGELKGKYFVTSEAVTKFHIFDNENSCYIFLPRLFTFNCLYILTEKNFRKIFENVISSVALHW